MENMFCDLKYIKRIFYTHKPKRFAEWVEFLTTCCSTTSNMKTHKIEKKCFATSLRGTIRFKAYVLICLCCFYKFPPVRCISLSPLQLRHSFIYSLKTIAFCSLKIDTQREWWCFCFEIKNWKKKRFLLKKDKTKIIFNATRFRSCLIELSFYT